MSSSGAPAPASGGGKSAQISILVQQLKDNVITKEELFAQLQRLQRGETVVVAAAATAGPGGGAQPEATLRQSPQVC